MKKITKIVMALMMAFVLAACGNAQNAENTEPAEQGASSGEKLIVGLEAGFPPYEYIGDGGEVVGIDIDISKKIAEKAWQRIRSKRYGF